VIVAFTALLAVGAVFAVISLHKQADRSRQAQVRLADVETAAQQLATVPLVSLYQSESLGRKALVKANRRLATDLRSLRRLAPGSELERIAGSSHVFSKDVGQILTLIVTLKAIGIKRPPEFLGSFSRAFAQKGGRFLVRLYSPTGGQA